MEDELKELKKVAKIEFITAIVYCIIAVIVIIGFTILCIKDNHALVLIPFLGTVESLTAISIIIKYLANKNAEMAVRKNRVNEMQKVNKHIEKALKKMIESSILDEMCSLIFIGYIIYTKVVFYESGIIDKSIIKHFIIAFSMLVISIVKALPSYKVFGKYFDDTIKKENNNEKDFN